jgi:hypothetical protein
MDYAFWHQQNQAMKNLCNFYIAKAELIGALYCLIPTLVGFGVMFCVLPFREVYVVRLAIALLVGAPVAAYLNRFGLSLWMIKHASPKGPATVLDGSLIGCLVGMAIAVIPSLTHLIASSNPDRSKTSIIIIWLAAGAAGAILGAFIASIGRKYLERQ